VDGPDRLILGDQSVLAHKGFRQRIGNRIENVEHLAHACVDLPGLHLLVGRVDREEVAREGVEQVVAGGTRGLRNGLERARSPHVTGVVQHQERRVGQLHGALEVADLTGQHHPRAFDQLPLDELDVEEGRGHLRLAVTEGDDEVFAFGLFGREPGLGLRDDVDERDVGALLELLTLLGRRHLVAVLARVVAQQVVDRVQAEVLRERVGRLLAEHVDERIGQFGHRHSTPISSTSPRCPV
jgi:hypothetical protein